LSGGRALLLSGVALVVVAAGAAAWLVVSGDPPVEPKGERSHARLETGDLSEFSQVNELAGKLSVTDAQAHGGESSARALYRGGAPNGYARGIFNVDWPRGSDVAFSGAFYIPSATLDALQGQMSLMRWDDFESRPNDPHYGGIVIYGRDRRLHMVSAELPEGREEQTDLTVSFEVPVDRWFTVEVRQRLGGDDARNEVYLEGDLVAESERPNLPAGRTVQRVRYGIVSTAGRAQVKPLELFFDDAAVVPGAVPEG
jgi:hypothetical protein